MDIEDLKNMDFENIDPKKFREVLEVFLESPKGLACMAAVILKAVGLINVTPLDMLDQLIQKIEEQDLHGGEEEARDNVVDILKAIRQFKPTIDPILNKVRENLHLKARAGQYGNLPKRR